MIIFIENKKWNIKAVLVSRIFGGILKVLADLMPKRLKSSLKKNDSLFNFYARALQKSGMFYGFPTPKQYNHVYQKVFKRQQKYINQLPESKKTIFDLVILVPIGKVKSIPKTLINLSKTLNVHIICRMEDVQKVERVIAEFPNKIEVYGAPVAMVNTENSIFIIYAGQILHDDTAKVLYHHTSDYDVVYTDKDWVTNAEHHSPILLPNWNPDLQLTSGYIRTGVWFRCQSDLPCIISNHAQTIAEMAASIYLNLLNINCRIGHIPYTLVHETETRKFNYANYANTLSNWTFEKANIEVLHDVGMLVWQWKHNNPLVSIIIPTYNSKQLVEQCIESILTSTYENFEILLVDNASDDKDALDYFDTLKTHPKISVLKYKETFNYSAINNFAVHHAMGEVIALVNNDIKVINQNWLEHMVGHVMRTDIGCVGAKLLYEDGRIQHAGVVLGYGGGAGHAFKYFPRYHPGYIKRLLVTHNYSAVTAACLLVKKADYEAVGGLNESELAIAFNDVDFCLRVAQLGRRNLYCAETELFHYESVSRGLDTEPEKRKRFQSELRYLKQTWKTVIENDPAYNPNLTLKRENFSPKIKEEYKGSKD